MRRSVPRARSASSRSRAKASRLTRALRSPRRSRLSGSQDARRRRPTSAEAASGAAVVGFVGLGERARERIAVDLEAGVADHAVGLGDGVAPRREVALDEERVRGPERERREPAQVALAPRGNADLGARIHEPHHGERAQAALGRERAVAADRVALDRDQEVHRDRGHLELAQLEGHLDHVGARLAHAEDQAAARLDAVFLGRHQRAHAVGVAVGRADLGVVRLAGVEVVVQAVEPGVREDAGVLVAQQADREADLDRVALLHLADQLAEPARALERRAAAREHHAVARRARARGALGARRGSPRRSSSGTCGCAALESRDCEQ